MIKINELLWVSDLSIMGKNITDKVDLDGVYCQILAHVVSGMDANGGSLAMVDDVYYDTLRVVATRGLSAHAIGAEMALGNGELGYVAKQGKALLFNGGAEGNASCWTDDIQASAANHFVSAMCFPLQFDDKRIGALMLFRTELGCGFTMADLECCNMLVNMAAMVIGNVRIHMEYHQMVQTLSALNQEIFEKNVEEIEMNKRLEGTQNQLLQSEKMASIGQLAAGVAHEINNPIGYVYSNLGTLEKYVQDVFSMIDSYEQAEGAITDGTVRARLQTAREKLDLGFLKEDLSALMAESKDGITRVKQIVQNLKDFSHVDAADEWHYANLHDGINSTLNIVNNEIKYKAEVVNQYGDIPEVECLPSQLNQVFMNLLVNAVHAIEERGTITVRSGKEGKEVWVEIADTGKGIPPENLTKIFDPFFTTKPIGQGTGLGLSLSYGIIQKHHGRIEVQSEPGKGTAFRVWLPERQPRAKT